MTNDPNRQPRGTSAGGQFAANLNPESTIELDDEGSAISRAGELCSVLSGPDVVGSPAERMLWHHAYDISNMAFKAGLSDKEATERISAALDETIKEAQAMKDRLAGNAEPSPYADFPGFKVSDLKSLIADLPDDEPLLFWVTSRADVANYVDQTGVECSPEQWMDIYDTFGGKTDHDYGPWSSLSEAFSEAVDETISPEDEESFQTQMNRDDFLDLYAPLIRPGETKSDPYGSVYDLETAKKYPNDRVWTAVIGDLGEEVIVNGLREEGALGYYITDQPWNDEYDYTVTR